MADETPTPVPPDPADLVQSTAEVEKTRRMIVRYIFVQFNLFVVAMLAAMVLRGWELSPVASNLFGQVFQVESLGIATAVGFYLGSSYGSALKDMAKSTMMEKK